MTCTQNEIRATATDLRNAVIDKCIAEIERNVQPPHSTDTVTELETELSKARAVRNMILLCGQDECGEINDPATRLRSLIDEVITLRADNARMRDALQEISHVSIDEISNWKTALARRQRIAFKALENKP